MDGKGGGRMEGRRWMDGKEWGTAPHPGRGKLPLHPRHVLRTCQEATPILSGEKEGNRKDAKGGAKRPGSIGRSATSPLTATAALRFAPCIALPLPPLSAPSGAR